MQREGLVEASRPKLCGFKAVEPSEALQAGAILVATATAEAGCEKLGHISSVTYSPSVGANIALGFLREADSRRGQRLFAAYPLKDRVVEVEVCDACFVDPSGGRMRA